jgi:transcriptional antiterminator NusG
MNAEERPLKWYVIQALSGYEHHAEIALKKVIAQEKLENTFGQIIVPIEEVLEIRKGQKRKVERKPYPGYIFAQIRMSDDLWHVIKKIPKIVGFVGGKSGEPTPLTEVEAERMLSSLQKMSDKPRPKVLFEVGEVVRVNDGPFADFNGTIEDIDYERNRLSVAVVIFGRSTPVELDFSQVEKS